MADFDTEIDEDVGLESGSESESDSEIPQVVMPDPDAEDILATLGNDLANLPLSVQKPEWMEQHKRKVKELVKRIDQKQKAFDAKTKQVFHVYIDTEFTSEKNLSLQAVLKGKVDNQEIEYKFVVIDSSLEPFFSQDILTEVKRKESVDIFFSELNLGNAAPLLGPIHNYLRENHDKSLKLFNTTLYCWLYFSPTDLNIAFGADYMRKAYLGKKGNLRQRRSLSGRLTGIPSYPNLTVVIRDLYGLDSKGLDNLANTYNVTSNIKKALDKYKSNMFEAVKLEPKLFLEYGIDDVVRTSKIPSKVVETFNLILNECFGLKDPKLEFNILSIPLTIGSLVHNILIKLIRYGFFKNNEAFLFSISKLCVLNKNTIHYDDNIIIFSKIRKLKTIDELQKYLLTIGEALKKAYLEPKSFNFTAYQFASAKWCLAHGHNNNLVALATTSGGRTVNERPKEFFMKHAVDADIVGAYGSLLKKYGIPLGKPHVYTESPNVENNLTLGKFMQNNQEELNHPYWKLTVSGKLTFCQDLIYSRISTKKQNINAVADLDLDDTSTLNINRETAILRNEIIDGVITEPIWNILAKVCSNKEFGEIKNLRVTNAIYWKNSERCTLDDFSTKCLEDNGQYKFDPQGTSNRDTRGHYWCVLPLDQTVSNLMNKREELKKQTDDVSKAKEQGLKLIINTIYGVICSVFFSLHNTVVGDLITSSVRCACWMMAKAFLSYISVTDGSPFSLNTVAFIKPDPVKKPGMHVLSSYYSLINHPSIEVGPLNGEDWSIYFDSVNIEKLKTAAKLSKDHINSFWSRYDLDFPFNLEIKHFINIGSYFSKAHYIFQAYNPATNKFDDPVVKIRGFRQLNKEEVPFQNPMFDLLSFMLKNPEKGKDQLVIPNNNFYETKKLLKVESWKKSLIKQGPNKKGEESYFGPDILPGDSVLVRQQFRLNNTHFPIYDLAHYRRVHKRGFRKQQQKKHEKHIPTSDMPYQKQFEKYLPNEGLHYMLKKMAADSLISKTIEQDISNKSEES